MNGLQHLPPKVEADLRRLTEPVGAYISALEANSQQKLALLAALILLTEGVQQINGAAQAHIASFKANARRLA